MITSVYAGILGLVFFKISMDTISARWKHKVSLGFGSNNEIASIVSAHNNFAAYGVFLLFLLYLAETSQTIPYLILHLVAIAFTAGRLLHFAAFRSEKMNFKVRKIGMHLTLWPLVLLSVMNLYAYIIQNI